MSGISADQQIAVKSEPEASIRQGSIGDQFEPGEVVLTGSGRETTPFPAVDFSTPRKGANSEKRINEWLISNAVTEAKVRNDSYNLQLLENINKKTPTTADKDLAESYLFTQKKQTPSGTSLYSTPFIPAAREAAKLLHLNPGASGFGVIA